MFLCMQIQAGATLAAAPPSGRVLVIDIVSPPYPERSEHVTTQIDMLLRHFTPDTTIISAQQYRAGAASNYDRIVIVGNDPTVDLAPDLLKDLAEASAPILWIGHGLEQIPVDQANEFGFVVEFATDETLPTTIEYRGQRFPSVALSVDLVRVEQPTVHVLATYDGPAGSMPYVLQGGNLLFVNGIPDLDYDHPDPESAGTLIFADVLHEFFDTQVGGGPEALIRLEDVSIQVDPERLLEIADFMTARHAPYAIGVIPAQRLETGEVIFLYQRPELVRALRYAQDRGATIVLHGYHHTFGGGEDYEFWDGERQAPQIYESEEAFARKLEDGIRILRDVGLEPRLWETPHYAGSPLAYTVFGKYFSHAFENRDPWSWLPYPAGPDPYGQYIIPENLGYISPGTEWTVDAQLARASTLRIVRDAWAVGFYHPASVEVDELKRLVDGLASLGYRFADLRGIPMEVRSDYRPSPPTRLKAWLQYDLALPPIGLVRGVARQAGIALRLGGLPWPFIIAAATALAFLARLRTQWQPAAGQRSRVRGSNRPVGMERARPLIHRWRAVALAAAATIIVLAVGTATARQTVVDRPADLARPGTAAGLQVGTASQPAATGGWELSVYYTPVETFYVGADREVRGCPVIDCRNGSDLLGVYPADFVAAVKEEGNGRITRAPHVGQYLNWSIDVGFWLDLKPRDARGGVLVAYVSAAADPSIPFVTPFKVVTCGSELLNGSALAVERCARVTAASWIVRDRFTVGSVGKHLDLYIGEQDQPDFVQQSPHVFHTRDASVTLREPVTAR